MLVTRQVDVALALLLVLSLLPEAPAGEWWQSALSAKGSAESKGEHDERSERAKEGANGHERSEVEEIFTLGAAKAHEPACPFKGGIPGSANPGVWPPAVVAQAAEVTVENMAIPEMGEGIRRMIFNYFCRSGGILAADFTYRVPTAEGGDWIASFDGKSSGEGISFEVNGKRCPLTSIAVQSSGAPYLRLHFDNTAVCKPVAGVSVALTRSRTGMNLVPWMCSVAGSQKLCADAISSLTNLGVQYNPGVAQTLDTTMVVKAMATMTREQLLPKEEGCFEPVDWYQANFKLPVNADEWDMLMEIRAILESAEMFGLKAPATAILQQDICVPDCMGEVREGCFMEEANQFQLPDVDLVGALENPNTECFNKMVTVIVGPFVLFFALGVCCGLCGYRFYFPSYDANRPIAPVGVKLVEQQRGEDRRRLLRPGSNIRMPAREQSQSGFFTSFGNFGTPNWLG